MRVALILLFLLSLGAIPGSLIPQDSVDEVKVRRRKAGNEFSDAGLREAPALRRLQLGVVLRDLHPAVRVAHRLHRPAQLAVRRAAARPAAGRAPSG